MDNDEEAVRRRAYELWESAGRPHGEHLQHWLKAFEELAEIQGRQAAGRAGQPDEPLTGVAAAQTPKKRAGKARPNGAVPAIGRGRDKT